MTAKQEKFKEFQLFCRFCLRKFHASSIDAALIEIDSHEQKCVKNPLNQKEGDLK